MKKQNNDLIGDLIVKDKILYGPELIFDYLTNDSMMIWCNNFLC